MNIKEQAIKYLSMGFSIIPINPSKEGKTPLIKWAQFQQQKPLAQDVDAWFTQWPNANIGILTGKASGLTVIDFDSEEAVEAAESKGLLNTPLVKTQKGIHAYYKYCPAIPTATKINAIPDTDIRNEGALVVAPPSSHGSGHKYHWVKGKSIGDIPFGNVPEWFIASFKNDTESIENLLFGVPEGMRTNTGLKIIGTYIKRGISKEVITQKMLEWNSKCTPPEKENVIIERVRDLWARDCAKSGKSPDAIVQEGVSCLDKEFVVVTKKPFKHMPTAQYPLELIHFYDDVGIYGRRINFVFKVLKHKDKTVEFVGNELKAFFSASPDNRICGRFKLTKWAAILLNKTPAEISSFGIKDLIGKRCLGDVELKGNTNKITKIHPWTE